MTGHEYFIKNFLKIKQPDGSFKPMEIRETDRDFLKKIEDAEKNGLTLKIFKGRNMRTRFGFGPRKTK